MNYWDKKLMREQVDAKLQKLLPLISSDIPTNGWIKLIRESLGMSTNSLAKRAGLDQSCLIR